MENNISREHPFTIFVIGLIFLLPIPAHADCSTATMGSKPVGYVFRNADYDVLQVCRSDGTWQAISPIGCPAGDGCSGGGAPTGCSNPGDLCSDGSVYAGQSPDGNVKMYTTPADAPGTYDWNNGTSNWINTSMVNCTTATPGGEPSCQTGEANTALLVGLSDAASPYAAAAYCDSLSAHSQGDWYLPAQDELDVLYQNRATIGGFVTTGAFPSGYYWSSSESFTDGAKLQVFSDGSQTGYLKTDNVSVRCVRKDP